MKSDQKIDKKQIILKAQCGPEYFGGSSGAGGASSGSVVQAAGSAAPARSGVVTLVFWIRIRAVSLQFAIVVALRTHVRSFGNLYVGRHR